MDSFRRNPVFLVWLALCVLAVAGGLYWLNHQRAVARRELVAVARASDERDRLERENPAPGEESRRAIEAELAGAGQKFAMVLEAIKEQDDSMQATPLPDRPIDAYFEIATFVEQMRALAGRLQVLIKKDEHFGFAAHANEGPVAGTLTAVSRQRRIVQMLVEALLAARPRELLAVQRERLPARGSRAVRSTPAPPASKGVEAADFFEADRRLVVGMPDLVNPWMIRLVFAGQTPALRDFLNSVAACHLPLVVRSVEVEPLVAGAGSAPSGGGRAEAPVPLIAQNLSKFSVVVEFAALEHPGTPSPP